MLLGVDSMYKYYEYTGKTDFLFYVYPHIKNYLALWKTDPQTGLVEISAKDYLWEWGDSAAEIDYVAIENAWYYLALSRLSQMADVIGQQEDKATFDESLANLKAAYDKLWTENGYKTEKSKIVDERANAVAVISGLAEEEKYETISNMLTTSYQSTVFMENYALEALCKMGKIEEAQKRIRDRYKNMVDGEMACSTLWESWEYEAGSKNHAWAGGPLIIMSKYFAGIEPLKPGYDEISIKPQFGELTEVSAKATTLKGDIELEAEKNENSTKIKINIPTKTRVAIPKVDSDFEIKMNNKTIYKDGKNKKNKKLEFDTQDDEYVYFYVKDAGEYEFVMEKK